MKKFTITGYDQVSFENDLTSDKSHMIIEGAEVMDASDGYHTFTELYDHRIALWIAVCRLKAEEEIHHNLSTDGPQSIREVWRSKLHSDGTEYEGWFVLGMNKKAGEQMTYHLPIDRWGETEWAETLEKAPEFDGHTSKDVLTRINQSI